MTPNTEARRLDIANRLGVAVGEQNLTLPNTTAYKEISAVVKSIRREYQNGVKTRVELRYHASHYYGFDTSREQ